MVSFANECVPLIYIYKQCNLLFHPDFLLYVCRQWTKVPVQHKVRKDGSWWDTATENSLTNQQQEAETSLASQLKRSTTVCCDETVWPIHCIDRTQSDKKTADVLGNCLTNGLQTGKNSLTNPRQKQKTEIENILINHLQRRKTVWPIIAEVENSLTNHCRGGKQFDQ